MQLCRTIIDKILIPTKETRPQAGVGGGLVADTMKKPRHVTTGVCTGGVRPSMRDQRRRRARRADTSP